MRDSESIPQLLTMEQLADRLGVTRRHVRRLVDERRVPFLRVGRFIRFDRAQIAEWLDSNRVPKLRTRVGRAVTTRPCTPRWPAED
jgi:excisionase family DNA binding protein